ncbi:helix-turn-helix domain-containing protein [Lawsonibacter hominis]|uniref:Helix-turn-helix transcriptional regulator n=1 Tax=Lawsonibacter hominis TaxID=2763053 RepID=A0A8J6M9P5_9FIRM|nr:helix-turn-helix transcriptional regulator [Lawsonibacter hominis]MBC5732784.1 helix-turn-helix transcriptional regulator [Lawsonibacter hominis]
MAKTVRLKLNRYLDERRISRYALAKMSGIKYQTIDHYYKNWVVRYDSATLGGIITALDCGIEDILEVVEEEEPEEPGGPRHMARASGFPACRKRPKAFSDRGMHDGQGSILAEKSPCPS